MKKYLSAIGIWLLIMGISYAGVGTTGASFLMLGGGARPLGLGDAYTGLADDLSSLFYNPAGLSGINYSEVTTMYNNWLAGTVQQMAGVAVPTNFGVLALGYSGLNSGNIQGYDATGALTSVFTTASSTINLALSRRVNPNLSLGASVKSISERLENNSASSLAFDAGLKYRFNSQLQAGLAVLNLGSPLKFITEQTPLPTTLRVGAAYATTLFDEDLNLATDIVNFAEGTKLDLGLEYIIRDFLALRLGSSAGTLRAGIGLSANLLALDYAYLGHSDLGATHQVSLSILFGGPLIEKKRVLEELALGKAYLKEQKYAEAALKFEKVLSLDPKNQEAQISLDKSRNELETQAFEKVFAEKKVETARTAAQIMESGKRYLDQKKYLEALGEFSNALKLEPTNREALKLQNEAQSKMESQLIEQSKTEARAYLGEAMKFVVTGKYQQASDQVNKALEKDPRNKQAQDLKKKLDLILKLEKR